MPNAMANSCTNTNNTIGGVYIIRDPRDVVLSTANHFGVENDEATRMLINIETYEIEDDMTPYIKNAISKVLSTLTPKEEVILRWRFGIGMDRPHTLSEIGARFFVGSERIRQIEAKAIRKLKHPTRSRILKEVI